jgi:CMP-2-keto-3-deoxyoctulosonic acid synthetase
MSVNQSDLDSFHDFASQAIAHQSANLSLEELLEQWRTQREQAEAIASIRRGVEDAGADRSHNLDHVDTKIRGELGFPARRR